MNYLLDKKQKRKKIFKVFCVVFLFVLFFYFREPIYNGLSYTSSILFKPFLSFGNNTKERFTNFGSYLVSKENLFKENKRLKEEVEIAKAGIANYQSVAVENEKLKEILGRESGAKDLVLGIILAKPKQSVYGSFLIDIGTDQGVEKGNTVFAFGNIPIGKISDVYPSTSKVILYSAPKEELEVSIGDKYFLMKGRGGGNFEIEAPRDFIIEKGTEVNMPNIAPKVVAKVETIISDPRDSFQKIILISPLNISELKFVQVEVK